MNHPNLSNEINSNIAQSEIEGGVYLKDIQVGKTLLVQTKNTLYTIRKHSDMSYTIKGHDKFCPVETKCRIHGSTWGSSMLKVAYIGRGMRLEFSTVEYNPVTTSTIQEITEQ